MLRSFALLLVAGLLAGCAGSNGGGDGEGSAATGPEPEAGILRGSLTALESTATTPLSIANAGHGRLAATLVLVTNAPSNHVSLNVSGPSGQSTEVDTGPILYAFPGQQPTMSFEAPEVGEWTASVELENGASAEYEVHWCADDATSPGPQDNLACQRDYD